jgi:hypothetical protein
VTIVGPDGTAWPAGSLRAVEHQSIRAFVQAAADEGYLSGRVLDYGCGQMPYREIVLAAGGDHFVFDSHEFPGSVVAEGFVGDGYKWRSKTFNAILCTQVVQYVPDVQELIAEGFFNVLAGENGVLVMTYPTNWPEVEPEDLHRFTKTGMARLLTEASFSIVRHERRGVAAVSLSGDEFALGYGVIARA